MAIIKAVRVSENHFIGRTTLSDIRGNCPDPRRVDRSTEAQRTADRDLQMAYNQRGSNQRKFNKARTERAIDYSQYIKAVDDGVRMGGYPPITLWTEQEPIYDEGKCELSIIGASILTANDGETQLAARYMLAQGFSEKDFNRIVEADRGWLDRPFAISITTKSDCKAAQQTLHDMNHYATPVSEKDTATLNVEGGLTKALNSGIEKSGTPTALIKGKGEVKSSDNFNTSTIALLHGAIGALYGAVVFNGPSSPSTWISEGNRQFETLNGKGEIVSNFIEAVLQLPPAQLKTITCDHMIALGVKFNELHRIVKPLGLDQYAAVMDAVKDERNGRRASLKVRSKRVYDTLVD